MNTEFEDWFAPIKEELKQRQHGQTILKQRQHGQTIPLIMEIAEMAFDKGEEKALRFESKHEQYDSMSVPDLAIELKRLKNELEKFDAIKKEYQKAYDYLSIDVLPERMDEERIETIKIPNVGRLQARSDIRCSVPAKNKGALQNWLVSHGHGSMISESINSSTLKAFVMEMMKENKEWPKDLLNVHPYSRATVVNS